MLTETMFTLGRKYAIADRNEQERIMRDAMLRINHWMKKDGDNMITLFSCFMQGAMSIEPGIMINNRDDTNA